MGCYYWLKSRFWLVCFEIWVLIMEMVEVAVSDNESLSIKRRYENACCHEMKCVTACLYWKSQYVGVHTKHVLITSTETKTIRRQFSDYLPTSQIITFESYTRWRTMHLPQTHSPGGALHCAHLGDFPNGQHAEPATRVQACRLPSSQQHAVCHSWLFTSATSNVLKDGLRKNVGS